jgi:Family of unknown function (DUF5317)
VILIVLSALCVMSVPLTRGSLSRLGQLHLRWLWVAPTALALQVLIITIAPGGNHRLHAIVHIGTYVLLGIFLWANRRIAGVSIIALGALANAIAIVANSGVMPASIVAQRLAGVTVGRGFQNSAPVLHPHLLWLGDIIPEPGPLANVMSIGDLIIFAGLLVLLHRTTHTHPVEHHLSSAPQPPHARA